MPRLRWAALAAVALLCAAAAAMARPYTVDDLLARESFGRVLVDPAGRWAVIERRDAHDSAGRYDLDQQVSAWVSRLVVTDLAAPAAARPLIAGDPRGVMAGDFSPSGARLAVYRLDATGWRLGVVTLASGAVRWFDLVPDRPETGRGLAWLSDEALVVLDRTDRRPPWRYRMGHAQADALPGRWATSARGEVSVTAQGSGAFAALTGAPAPVRAVRLEVGSGAVRPLAAGRFEDLAPSPDGRWLALREAREPVGYAAGRPLHGDWGIATRRQRLVLIDLRQGRELRPCPACDLLPQVFAWSPDGRRLLVFARADATPWPTARLLTLAAATGQVTDVQGRLQPLIEGRPEIVRAAWWGADPILYARDGGARLDWFRLTPSGAVRLTRGLPDAPRDIALPDDRTLVAVSEGRVWRVRRDGGGAPAPGSAAVTALRGRRFWIPDQVYFAPSRTPWVVSADGRTAWAAGARRPAAPLAVPAESEVVAATAPGASGSAHALTLSRDARGVESVLLASPPGPPRVLATVNVRLADVDPVRVLRIAHAGPDGQPLSSWLFLPPAGATPPPLVVRAYSGEVYARPPQAPAAPAGTVADIRLLVSHGYAVLTPSLPRPRGTPEPMAGLAERILAVVDAAAADSATAGTFDPDRVALWGHSYGAYTVLGALTQSARFRAGVTVMGAAQLAARWGDVAGPSAVDPEADMAFSWSSGWVESLQGGMLAPPWAAPDRYIRNSPLFAADRITAPVLMVWGDADVAQQGNMFAALARQGKDAIALTYWGEGHQLSSPGNIRDFYARAFAFLDRAFSRRSADDRAAPSASPGSGSASGGPRPRSSPPR